MAIEVSVEIDNQMMKAITERLLLGLLVYALSLPLLHAADGVNPILFGDTNTAGKVCRTPGTEGDVTTSGVVNTYYPGAASVAAGATSITLDAAIGASTSISAGDLLLIIQMQDAEINSDDSVDYGDGAGNGAASGSTDIRNTGLYEFAVASNSVLTSTGGTLNLYGPLKHSYNHDATTANRKTFQVIRVPRYDNLTLNGTLTATPWNGRAGGVVALDVLGTLNLNGQLIDVAAKGFRGGIYWGGLWIGGDQSNYMIADNDGSRGLFAEKGEGIAGKPAMYTNVSSTIYYQFGIGYPGGDLARGAPGNAGGGGNGINAGGGGGGNIGAGGQGGRTWRNHGDTTHLGEAYGGKGGGKFTGYYNGRLFMGGGGGAGHANDHHDKDSVGGDGGGLVLINATTIIGTGTIDASGGNGTGIYGTNAGDGGGGGGAGGTVLIRANDDSSATLTVDVSGGNGADTDDTDAVDWHGPGGGGGGGALYLSSGLSVNSLDASGGAAGIVRNEPAVGTYGATNGGNGMSQAVTINENDQPAPVACDFPDENGYSADTTVHKSDHALGAPTLSLGATVDYEPIGAGNANADADDNANNGVADDEDGVSFTSNGGVTATVSYSNPTGANVTVCGWLDGGDNGSINGAYEAAEGQCRTTSQTSGAFSFTWSGLPQIQGTTYARFRITTDSMSTSEATGVKTNGEVESYKIQFDFRPTVVTIGQVSLSATRVVDFLDRLEVSQMDNAALAALLAKWDSTAAADAGSSRQALLQALEVWLDPDGDGQVAVLSWDTLEERGTIGFWVERRQNDSDWQRLNRGLLPGLMTAPLGGEYMLADPAARVGNIYQYRLIEQEARGNIRAYGPYTMVMP